MKHTEDYFDTDDGKEIYYQAWHPEREVKAIVQVVHGLAEHSGRYKNVVEALVPEGYIIYANDHRGHGRSATDEDKGYVEDFNNFVKDERQFTAIIREKEGEQLPLFLLGHSMGSIISILYAAEQYKKFDGIILSGCGTGPKVSWFTNIISRVMRFIDPKRTIDNTLMDVVSRDQTVVENYREDPYTLKEMTLNLAVEVFNGATQARKAISNIKKTPILLQAGSEDQLMANPRGLYSKVSIGDKTLKIYPELYHEVYNELEEDRKQVLEDLEQWLNSRIKSY